MGDRGTHSWRGVGCVRGLLVTGRRTGGGSPGRPKDAARPQTCPPGPWPGGEVSPGRDESCRGLLRRPFPTLPPKLETPSAPHIWPDPRSLVMKHLKISKVGTSQRLSWEPGSRDRTQPSCDRTPVWQVASLPFIFFFFFFFLISGSTS
uniref:Uncharacterized protein n=1 Tax=Rousettus aegyptiacus TaxID=9407 RepID=A0A7J8BA67_ROUAE|nr:hypothetical protein HJG63_009932 [Rousettus aegyptiacus]